MWCVIDWYYNRFIGDIMNLIEYRFMDTQPWWKQWIVITLGDKGSHMDESIEDIMPGSDKQRMTYWGYMFKGNFYITHMHSKYSGIVVTV